MIAHVLETWSSNTMTPNLIYIYIYMMDIVEGIVNFWILLVVFIYLRTCFDWVHQSFSTLAILQNILINITVSIPKRNNNYNYCLHKVPWIGAWKEGKNHNTVAGGSVPAKKIVCESHYHLMLMAFPPFSLNALSWYCQYFSLLSKSFLFPFSTPSIKINSTSW